MEAIPSTKRILLVTSDSFVLGMVSGYCFANLIEFQSVNPQDLHIFEEPFGEYGLVVMDCRIANGAIGLTCSRKQLQRANQIIGKSKASLGAIISEFDDLSDWREQAALFYLVQEPLTEQLPQCFDQHFGCRRPYLTERRRGERRKLADRRHSHFSATSDKIELPSAQEPWQLGPFTIDLNCNAVHLQGRNLELSSKEFRLFKLLASNPAHVFSAEELISGVWPQNGRANKADLYQYMHLLRKKVETDPYHPKWIATVKGKGYQLKIELKQTGHHTLTGESKFHNCPDKRNFSSAIDRRVIG